MHFLALNCHSHHLPLNNIHYLQGLGDRWTWHLKKVNHIPHVICYFIVRMYQYKYQIHLFWNNVFLLTCLIVNRLCWPIAYYFYPNVPILLLSAIVVLCAFWWLLKKGYNRIYIPLPEYKYVHPSIKGCSLFSGNRHHQWHHKNVGLDSLQLPL